MNVLTDPLPFEICVDGESLPVRTDFRAWIQFIEIVQEYSLNELSMDNYTEMMERVCGVLFEKQPKLSAGLFPAIAAFFSGYSNGKKGGDEGEKTFDYNIDADAIYASFLQVYGIRLAEEQLHWYEFRALFANLPEDCPIGRLIHIRTMKESDVAKEKRMELRKLKESVALPAFRSYDEDNEALTKLRDLLR